MSRVLFHHFCRLVLGLLFVVSASAGLAQRLVEEMPPYTSIVEGRGGPMLMDNVSWQVLQLTRLSGGFDESQCIRNAGRLRLFNQEGFVRRGMFEDGEALWALAGKFVNTEDPFLRRDVGQKMCELLRERSDAQAASRVFLVLGGTPGSYDMDRRAFEYRPRQTDGTSAGAFLHPTLSDKAGMVVLANFKFGRLEPGLSGITNIRSFPVSDEATARRIVGLGGLQVWYEIELHPGILTKPPPGERTSPNVASYLIAQVNRMLIVNSETGDVLVGVTLARTVRL